VEVCDQIYRSFASADVFHIYIMERKLGDERAARTHLRGTCKIHVKKFRALIVTEDKRRDTCNPQLLKNASPCNVNSNIQRREVGKEYALNY
jgi:hypothetical protein